MQIDILTEDPRWAALGLDDLAARCAGVVAGARGLGPDHEVSILAADDTRIAALNAAHRGKDGPTNVLSWPAEDLFRANADPHTPQEPELGDIALAYDTCAREAAAGNIPLDQHVRHLLVHGLLHLLGFDHETDADAHRMETLETALLEKLGDPDPYSQD